MTTSIFADAALLHVIRLNDDGFLFPEFPDELAPSHRRDPGRD
ncbi:hypothetical protein [Mesorhizobium sp. AR07]|nr:hypothetical protein [Mesorhizobium sp. AR07]